MTERVPKPTAMIVSGYFSPLHCGHLDMIEEAAAHSDHLIVIVNNNAQQIMKKGKLIIDEQDRLRIVNALGAVDEAMIAVDEDRTVSASLAVIAEQHPDYELKFANGGDRQPDFVPEKGVCDKYGIEMVFAMGGNEKRDSSSRINVELGLEDEPSAPPSATS